MRIILSGGGTGGHIYPALALREAILDHYPETEFLYVGTEKGLENKIVNEAGIPFQTIKIQGLKRSLSLENIKTAYYLLTAIQKSKKIIRDFKPDVVIGTGGYVCAPVLYAASKLGIPTLIHEQNSVAGITNKWLSRYVDKICICFEDVRKDFSKYEDKVVFTGNPRGEQVAQMKGEADLGNYGLSNDLPTVLIFGGSRGAQRINEVVMANLDHFEERSYQTLIATGDIYYQDYQKAFPDMSKNRHARVVSYIYNMPAVYRAVDLVVCRSGATTLTELTALGLPSVLIPSPNVTHNHQQHNAESLVHRGAAEMILEKDLTNENFLNTVDDLMDNSSKREEMGNQAKAMGVTDASERIIKVIQEITN